MVWDGCCWAPATPLFERYNIISDEERSIPASLNVFLECPESPPIDGHICNSPGIQVKLILREEIQS